MSFTASLSTTGNTAVITLAGSLDDNPAAEEFREKVAAAAGHSRSLRYRAAPGGNPFR